MPELPEVETVRRGLNSFILHQKITKIDVLNAKSFLGDSKIAENHSVIALRRFGKALIIDLDNDSSLMIHLRMTGQLIFDGAGKDSRYAAGHPSENFVADLPNRQTRVVITFENGTLYFNDQRKFGFIKILKTTEVKDDPFIKKLAKEPWVMPPAEFYEKLQKHSKSPVKSAILDQSILCGLGNIYADESLFLAKIHPATPAGKLSQTAAANLLKSACAVMDESIAAGGSTLKNYVKADGTRGDYLDLFAKVYHRDGNPCPVCGETIVKIKVAGRGTHFCPVCQKLESPQELNPSAKSEASQKTSKSPSQKGTQNA